VLICELTCVPHAAFLLGRFRGGEPMDDCAVVDAISKRLRDLPLMREPGMAAIAA
jgi:hypothetical protein